MSAANCGHHLRLAPQQRLDMLFDDGRYSVIELPKAPIDPLKFRDLKRYADRLKDAQAKAGRPRDAMLVAHGLIGGLPAVLAVFDFEFLGGSMGMAVGEALLAAGRLAVLQEAALVVVPASGGARMQEGILSLMQMPRTTLAVEMVKEAGLPLHRAADRPDHRRRLGLVRDAGRHHPGRARRRRRLCRHARYRGDDPREIARGFPARGIPAGARHDRHGRAARGAERDPRPDRSAADEPGTTARPRRDAIPRQAGRP